MVAFRKKKKVCVAIHASPYKFMGMRNKLHSRTRLQSTFFAPCSKTNFQNDVDLKNDLI